MLGIILQITQGTAAAHDTVAHAVQATQQASTQIQMSLWELILKGGVIMIPIFICSLLAVYFFIERFIALRKAGKSDKNFMTNKYLFPFEDW